MFPDIKMKKLLPKLTQRLKSFSPGARQLSVPKWSNVLPQEDHDVISQTWFWPRLGSFFRPKDIIVAETGTSSFGALEVALPPDSIYISQILWGSIGWTVGKSATLTTLNRTLTP
jgi:pyruvate decarboxylase